MAQGRLQSYCLKFVGLHEMQREFARNRKNCESTVVYYNILTGEVSCDVYNEFEKGPGEPWVEVVVLTPLSYGLTSQELVQITYERLFGCYPQDVAGYDSYNFGVRAYSTRWK